MLCRILTTWSSWQSAGRLWDILYQLAHIGDLPLPHRDTGHSDRCQRDSDGPPSLDSDVYTSPPATGELQFVVGAHRTRNPTRRRTVSQDHPIPSTSDYQESFDLLHLGNSFQLHTTSREITVGSGIRTAEHHEQSAASSQGQDPVYQGTHETTTMPAGGVPMNSDTVSAPLFSIDPLLYGDMMFNIGYAGAVASGIGLQGFGGFPSDGLGDTTPGQARLRPEPLVQQQLVDPLTSHNGGGRGTIPSTDGLTMWTNAPRGFE